MERTEGLLAIEFGAGAEADWRRRWEELAAEWRVWGYRLALKITGCPDAASDALQEALLRAFRAQRQVRDAGSPRAWFRKVLVRCAIDQRPKIPPETLAQAAVEDDQESLLRVRLALGRLEPKHRAILALALGEGLSYEEIAEMLEIPAGTVGSRLHYAKEAFRRAWGEP